MINPRIQHKGDLTENWEKAINFIPLAREIIVYTDLNKIKIGNGIDNVNDLPFLDEKDADTNTISLKGYYFNNANYDPHSSQYGTLELSMKQRSAYNDHSVDLEGYQVLWQPGDRISTFYGAFNYQVATIVEINNNIITFTTDNSLAWSGGFFPDPEEIEFDDWSCFAEYYDETSELWLIREGQIELARYSEAFGNINEIHAAHSYAFGKGNYVGNSAGGSFAMGRWNRVTGSSATAIGYSNIVTGNDAFAFGQGCVASGIASFAMGDHVEASGRGAHAEGGGNESSGYTKAVGAHSHAEGSGTQSIGVGSHSEGVETQATGETAHAEGYRSIAKGANSHAEGSVSTAEGNSSHAEGYNTRAQGAYSHAEGQSTSATGARAHAQGISCQAVGINSFAGGAQCIAKGNHSTALGYASQTTIEGESSIALGYATISSGPRQVIVGAYNKNDTDDKRSYFAVGCGVGGARRTGLRIRSTDTSGEVVIDAVNNKIANLADGIADTDAVNLKQLKSYSSATTWADTAGYAEEAALAYYAESVGYTSWAEEAGQSHHIAWNVHPMQLSIRNNETSNIYTIDGIGYNSLSLDYVLLLTLQSGTDEFYRHSIYIDLNTIAENTSYKYRFATGDFGNSYIEIYYASNILNITPSSIDIAVIGAHRF